MFSVLYNFGPYECKFFNLFKTSQLEKTSTEYTRKRELPLTCFTPYGIYKRKVKQSRYRPGVARGFQEVKVP